MKTILVFPTTATKRARTAFIQGIRDFMQGTGFNIQVIDFDGSPFPIRELLKFWSPAGCIVDTSGVGLKHTDIPTREFGRTPVVYFENADVPLPRTATCITLDAVRAGDIAAHEFFLLGFGNFAFLGRQNQNWSRRRRRAFTSAVRLNGCGVSVYDLRPDNKNIGGLARWLERLPKPCGLFAASDALGETVLSACRIKGIQVPYDIAVIGVDDDEVICEHTRPTLTSISPDFRQAGHMAASLLQRKIDRAGRNARSMTFPVSGIVRRGSTRLLKRRDEQVASAIERIRSPGGESLSAKEITAGFGCSRRSAEMRFRQITGHSILDEIMQARLALAEKLLSETVLPVSSVAERCGYASVARFRDMFRKATGMNPLSWRKRSSARDSRLPPVKPASAPAKARI